MAQSSSTTHPSPYVAQRTKSHFFLLQLSQALFAFVEQLLPTAEQLAIKEDVRKLLERLIRTIEPDSRLVSIGSTANGFSLRVSDTDLCCLVDSDDRLSPVDMVTIFGDLLQRETKFNIKPLPYARVPIIKLSLDPSPGLPLGIACDIGFENRLAVENTRLLMCYAMIDPTRVQKLVLFLKVWSKRRNINSPYQGTLSSYGYVLLVLYFLIHVKNPPVLPNLQQIRPISHKDAHIGEYDTWFFDDINHLRQQWQSYNTDTLAELLIDFFKFYSRGFPYRSGVASIRAGLLKKENKEWENDRPGNRYNDSRERNILCVEDPFEIDFNVARCVTTKGLYQIRGEFMRASRILDMRADAGVALAELCEDPQTSSPSSVFVPPRLSPQMPYTVGKNSIRPKGIPAERLSPRPEPFEPGNQNSGDTRVPFHTLAVHRTPKRTRWMSPPSPEARPAHHTMFEDQLGDGLALAASPAMEPEAGKPKSSLEHVDLLGVEERRPDATESDQVRSVHLCTEGSRATPLFEPATFAAGPCVRNRVPAKSPRPNDDGAIQLATNEATLAAYRAELLRRSHSGPTNGKPNRLFLPSVTSIAYPPPLEPTISTTQSSHLHIPDTSPSTITVFYETTATQPRFPTYPVLGAQSHMSPNAAFHMLSYPDQVTNNLATVDISRDGPSSPLPHSISHLQSQPSTSIASRVQRHRSRSPPQFPLRMHSGMGMRCGPGSNSSSPTSGSCPLSPSPTLLHSHAITVSRLT